MNGLGTKQLVAFLLLAFTLTACGITQPTANNSENVTPAATTTAVSQSSEGGDVTITATWAGVSAGPIFTIEMNTHAVDLDSYDLSKLAELRTDSGASVQPTGWDAPKGGHHRAGTLTFPSSVASGQPVIGPNTRTVELVIRDVAGVSERILRWNV